MKARFLTLATIVALAMSYGCGDNEFDGTTGPQRPEASPQASRELEASTGDLHRARLAEFVASTDEQLASTKRARPVDPCDQAHLAVEGILTQYLQDTAGLAAGSGEWCDVTGQAIDDLTAPVEVLEDCPGSQSAEAVGIFHDMYELWWGSC